MSQSKTYTQTAQTQLKTGASESSHASGAGGQFKARQTATDFTQNRLASAVPSEPSMHGPTVMRLEDAVAAQRQPQTAPGKESLSQRAGTWVRQQFQGLQQQFGGASAAAPEGLPQRSGPLVGIIDTGFAPGQHGHDMLKTIQTGNPDATILLADGVGTGTWPDSLTQFVDTSKAAGKSQAVVNLSFDLTQQNPDGSITTRQELTTQEKSALAYAQQNGVLVVASAGNEGGAMSALGRASQQSDNLIVVGAAAEDKRAAHSSYGKGLDFLVSLGQQGGNGTSQAAAEMTKTISQLWATNPNLTARQVVQVLEATPQDIQAVGWDAQSGLGIVNRQAALDRARDMTPESSTTSADYFAQLAGAAVVNPDGLGGESWDGPEGAIASERANWKGIGSAIGRVARRAGNVAGRTSRRTGNALRRRRPKRSSGRPKRSGRASARFPKREYRHSSGASKREGGRISSRIPKRGNRSSSRPSLRPSSARTQAPKRNRSNQLSPASRRTRSVPTLSRKPRDGYSRRPRPTRPAIRRRFEDKTQALKKQKYEWSRRSRSFENPDSSRRIIRRSSAIKPRRPRYRVGGKPGPRRDFSRFASAGLGLLGRPMGRQFTNRTAGQGSDRRPRRRLRDLTQIGLLPSVTRPAFQGRRGNLSRLSSGSLGILGRLMGRQFANRTAGRGGDLRSRRGPSSLTQIGMLPSVTGSLQRGSLSQFASVSLGALGQRAGRTISNRMLDRTSDLRSRRGPSSLTRTGGLSSFRSFGNLPNRGSRVAPSALKGPLGLRTAQAVSRLSGHGIRGIGSNNPIRNNLLADGVGHLARGTAAMGALPTGIRVARGVMSSVENIQRRRLAGDIRRQVRRSVRDLNTVNNVFSALERGRGRNIRDIARDFRGPSLREALRQRPFTSLFEGRRVKAALKDIGRQGFTPRRILGNSSGQRGKTIGIFGSFLRPTTVVSGVKHAQGSVLTARDVGRVLGFRPAPKPPLDRQTLPYGARFHETHAEQRRIFGSGALGRARRGLFGATQGVARRLPVSRAGRIANRFSGRLLSGGRSGAVSQAMCQIKGGCGEFHRLKAQASGRFDALATGIRGPGKPASVSLFSPDRTIRSIAPNISSQDLRRASRGIADDFRRSTPGVTRKASEGLRRVPVRGILGGARRAGPVGLVIGAGMDVVDLKRAHDQDGGFGSNFGVTASRVAGGWGGAAAGAAIGAAIGAPFAGVGAVPGAAIGAAIGGTLGSIGGSKAGEEIGEEIFE